ncbi:MAG: hypothetical protein WA139_05275 [Candidatus Aenigmatarchaeota archaeon]
MMIQFDDASYDPFTHIVPMKESREDNPIIPYSKAERLEKVVRMIQKDRRMLPTGIAYNAWRINQVFKDYKSSSASVLRNDSLCMIGIERGKFAYGKEFPFDDGKITENCMECIKDEKRGKWFSGGAKIKSLADVIGYAVDLEEEYLKCRQNLSLELKGERRGGSLQEDMKYTATALILSESWKAVANKEIEASIAKSRGRSGRHWKIVNTNGAEQTKREREIISECVKLRKRGLGDLADDLFENSRTRVVKPEDLQSTEYEPLQA